MIVRSQIYKIKIVVHPDLRPILTKYLVVFVVSVVHFFVVPDLVVFVAFVASIVVIVILVVFVVAIVVVVVVIIVIIILNF